VRGEAMGSELTKKEAAAISAAIAAYLSKQNSKEGAVSSSEIQKTLELIFKKLSELEKQIDALTSDVDELKSKTKKTER
jgi:hypothetical protein